MHKWRASLRSIWRLIAANLYDFRLLLWESRFALVGFSLLSVIGTVYFLVGYHDYGQSQVAPFTLLSALYETLRLLVFQSGLPLPANDPWGKTLFFVLPMLGLALVFQSVLNFGRFLLDKGSRQEAWQIALASTYREHVIIVGLGRIGYRVMTLLRETGYEVVVIERDWQSEFVSAALQRRVPVVLGDARQADILAQARLSQARGLIVTTSDDLLNIEIALVAQRAHQSINIVLRIFDDQLDSGLERGFGRNSAFSTSALAAPTLAAAAVSRNLTHVLTHNNLVTGIAELSIASESNISGFVRSIETVYGVHVMQQQRDGKTVVASQMASTIEGSDQITLLGSLDALERARMNNQPGNKLHVLSNQPVQRPTDHYDTVIVCGLGKIGYRVLRQLHQISKHSQIVVISTDNTRPAFVDAARTMGMRFIEGDARDPDILLAAGLHRAYSLMAITSDPLVNIQIGLAARRIRPDAYLVLRVFSDVLADRLALLFGIHTVYSASELAAPTLAASALAADISHAVRVGDQLFVQVAVRVSDAIKRSGSTPADLRSRGALLLSVCRAGDTVVLAPDESFQDGDELTLLVPLSALKDVRGF